MVNDLTTLSGALIECKDQLIYELGQQGVTATYDPTTGLLGLIAHIADIQGGGTILLATNKSILSYYDSETATLTATHSQGAGQTVEVYNATTGTKIGDMTDNNDGTYTYTYTSTGVGDISMTAVSGQTESNSILIEDCKFYGINTNAFTIPSGTTFSSDRTKITATKTSSGESLVQFTETLTSSDEWIYEVELAQIGTHQSMAVIFNDSTYYGGNQFISNTGGGAYYSYITGQVMSNITPTVGDKYRVVHQNGVTSVYVNDTVIDSKTVTHKSSFHLGFFINQDRVQYYKNIKIKMIPSQ